jgi:phosphoinositide-3-kinase regulatory subunit 4
MVAVEASKRTTDRTFTNLVEVWDIEKAVLVETFITRAGEAEALPEPHELTGVDADISPAAAIAALVHSKQSAVDAAGKRPRPSSQSTFQDELLPPPSPDVRALVVGLDFGGPTGVHRSDMADAPDSGHGRRGFMVTGSEDRKLRLWDLSKLERTTVLSGLESEHERPSFR